jgi:hypothetical protein
MLLIVVASVYLTHLPAQQWIEKKYTYDSTFDVVYGSAPNFVGSLDTLHFDLFQPVCKSSTGTERRPLMVILHGGAFVAGSKDDPSIQDLCRQFAKRGYVTASVQYRLGFIADKNSLSCNFPNYNCMFAADSVEWIRAYYRAIQDVKGAIRFLCNRQSLYKIDTANVFLLGESAGACIAMGVACMDVDAERPIESRELNALAPPNTNTQQCVYNVGRSFGLQVQRPDLGDINGDIEPSAINYTIRGVGNMYGAMITDLLAQSNPAKQKPAIYSFHQPCDLVVPFDSGRVLWGVNWCLTNGYGCYAIANTPMVYGSKAISRWNSSKNYGYVVRDDYGSVQFPYNFLIGSASCVDQVNTSCHAYDNRVLRENNVAEFFAPLVSVVTVCDTSSVSNTTENSDDTFCRVVCTEHAGECIIQNTSNHVLRYRIFDVVGSTIEQGEVKSSESHSCNVQSIASGMMWCLVESEQGGFIVRTFMNWR